MKQATLAEIIQNNWKQKYRKRINKKHNKKGDKKTFRGAFIPRISDQKWRTGMNQFTRPNWLNKPKGMRKWWKV